MAPIRDLRVEVDKDILRKNEIDANKALIKGSLATAILLIILIIAYATGLFKAGPKVLLNVYVSFPIMIVALLSTLIWQRTKYIAYPGFKSFLLIQYILVMFALNILLPKHTLLGWAICLILANHYFRPRTTSIVFGIVLVLMFLALYLGMLYGEWDANLMDAAREVTIGGETFKVSDVTFEQRVAYLAEQRANGNNRYLTAFLYYYLPRAATLTIISFICFALSGRSFKLLQDEVSVAKQNQKIQGELEVARAIQASVLPTKFPDNDREGVFAIMDPAKEVGGDFYDYFFIDDTHIAFVIADVSGKGVPAALFMMKTEALIKSLATSLHADTATILERSNVALCANNDASMFVTCWFGILDTVTGELRFSNAGHNSPLIISEGKAQYLTARPGVILGGIEMARYKETSIKLKQGDKIILYTDGVTEAHDTSNGLFGEQRLLEFTQAHASDAPRDFIPEHREELTAFGGGVEQFDDITILMVEYRKGAIITASRTFPADTAELDNLFNYSSSLLEILNFSKRDIIMINTALEEVFVNVAKYAYKDNGVVEVTLSNDQDHISFVFRDSGRPFNPLERADPKINANSDEREVGGLGIYMVKNIMDAVEYEYVDGHNVLTLIKKRNF